MHIMRVQLKRNARLNNKCINHTVKAKFLNK